MGIVGYGSIGEEVGVRAKLGFGMRVIAVKRHATDRMPAHVDEVHTSDALPSLLPQCDYVVC